MSRPLDRPMLRICLLGPIRATFDGRPVPPLGRRHSERLWAYLLLHRGAPLARDAVCRALWPDAGSEMLRYHLHHLATHLPEPPPGRSWIVPDRRTVCWNPDADCEVDLDAFEAACGPELRTAALARLRSAAHSYAGPLLEGIDASWLEPRREAVERGYFALLTELADRLARTEEIAEAIDVARRLVDHDPLHEPSHRLLMRLLADAGDRSAALAHFARLTGVLASELGDPPSPETVALAAAIRATGAAATGPDAATSADRDATGRDVAPATGTVATGPHAPPSAGAVAAVDPWTTDVRLTAQADVARLLESARLLTLTGPPGIQADTFARALLARLGNRFAGTPLWIRVPASGDRDALAGAVAAALGPPRDAASSVDSLARRLVRRRALLVLDGCEGDVESCADLCVALLRRCPELRLMAIGQARLDVAGETVWPVPLLAVRPEGHVPAGDRPTEAETVFLAHLGADAPRACAEVGALPAIAEIVRRLDGLPLAVALAGIAARDRPLPEIVARLDDAVPLLDAAGARLDPRISLRVLLDRTCRPLSPAARHLLELLSSFDGAFTVEDAEAAWSAPRGAGAGVPSEPVPDLLHLLVARSLVQPAATSIGRRAFRLLAVVRQHARSTTSRTSERRETPL